MTKDDTMYYGTGRRKCSTARVFVKKGTGSVLVNGKPVEQFFTVERHREKVMLPIRIAKITNKFDITVNVRGGGITGQAGAMALGLARALKIYDETLEPKFREEGLLTRDSRMVERKKYGRSGARRSYQFSKR